MTIKIKFNFDNTDKMNNKLRKLQSMNFKTILKYVFFPEEQANRFAKINFRPDLYTVLRNSPYLIIKGSRFRKAYLLDYRAGRVANNKIIPINLPPIELLICSTEKDFFLLNKDRINIVNGPHVRTGVRGSPVLCN